MERRIAVVMAVDELYAPPLLVTVTSLLRNLRSGAGLDLHLMASGLGVETRRRLERALDGRVELRWATIDERRFAALRSYGFASSPAANLRLLIGSSLPESLSKVIYLDADLLIQRDVVEIWDEPMRGNVVLAVQDGYIQELPESCRPWFEGADTARPYFNSGVMVIDLEAWRAAGMEQSCLEAARRLQHRSKWLDQDVLNACLIDRWGALPPVWNKQFSLSLFSDWRCSPYDEREFEEARRRPAIIHFSTKTKPWHPFCDHPVEDVLAYRAVMRGAALDEGLEARPSLARRALELLAAPHRRLLDTTAAVVRSRRRRYALKTMLPDLLKLAILHPWTLVTVPLSVARERIAMRVKFLSLEADEMIR